ncbi:MAG: Transketolase, central region [Candidatus Daviesbacteria bacterium GW2011_GWA1_41_61]|uniref:Transketolase, central region n=1 Tax=Candidatus Daviesbacteria bacterium GW2011_GWA2_40_9 TaxID=1618424 RepID=A0A0G0U8D8_9BACT|nr:MAG: Transketolase, central region [Candidatus Daviesbacteria bacterium GW2011_GWC1_40_9]KKR83526.1 MAG: Transketolase, central region [Candidatus Daviesbacteria bacterium GW2011_GWA2_40_9]KKR93094.1 MAG: Transketolase, central region [Candidatus Daviesbacteria bacterium GW2011_GWB1_41_15]KKS15638.1 MAG: Transketolase, central region [Candidatus Daviesbacteria bacterium GW2011_GWA1_41_61]
MINTKLNPKLFDEDMEMVSMREGFGEGLVMAGEENPQVVVLTADLEESTKVEAFAQKFPQRFVEVGVAEQNLAAVASGLAAVGKIPFMTSYAVFSPGRNWEQIRTTICYNNQSVKIIGSHAGLNVGADGATHQALEDVALMRVLPNMVVISPCDSLEAKKATLEIAKLKRPCYLRLLRDKTVVMTTKDTPFKIGQAEVFQEGQDVTVIACGQMVYQALLAARQLQESNISVRVINCSTIKPLDKKAILKAAEETGGIVTVEEHQAAGGLGSAVAEFLSGQYPIPVKIIGVEDKFGQSGEGAELLEKYGLTGKEIIKGILTVLRMKGKHFNG